MLLDNVKIYNARDSFRSERNGRIEASKQKYYFGISYLDDALQGILKGDLIIIAGDTGVGKTALATYIAKHNSFDGKKVYYLALEAKEREIERRIKYQYIASEYYNKKLHKEYGYLTYKGWLRNDKSDFLLDIETEVVEKYADKFKNLNVVYRSSGDFGIEELEKTVETIKDDADLIIVDHIHIFDIDARYENSEIKLIMKKLRDLATIYNKPIIAISHTRKNKGNNDSLVPTVYDLHGSSDIPKIGYIVITISPYYNKNFIEQQQLSLDKTPTLFMVAKDREDGSLSRFLGCHIFDYRTNNYSKDYWLGKTYECNKIFKKTTETPHWASNKVVEEQTSCPF